MYSLVFERKSLNEWPEGESVADLIDMDPVTLDVYDPRQKGIVTDDVGIFEMQLGWGCAFISSQPDSVVTEINHNNQYGVKITNTGLQGVYVVTYGDGIGRVNENTQIELSRELLAPNADYTATGERVLIYPLARTVAMSLNA